MTGKVSILLLLVLAMAPLRAEETRLSSDWELAAAERSLAAASTALARIAARLNLGDVRGARMERERSGAEYRAALAEAQRLRVESRRRSDLESYATATAYAGLAEAKLGRADASRASFEEALRYQSDAPRTWNLYSSALMVLRAPARAQTAARFAVALAGRRMASPPTAPELIDLAIYRYALASALAADGRTTEAETLLAEIVSSLESPSLAPIREEIARAEKFEVFSSVRNDADAWLSLHNRARLRLARLAEERGASAEARAHYEAMLRLRTDDPAALAGLAGLAANAPERERRFRASFDANPFDPAVLLEYAAWAGGGDAADPGVNAHAMQRAVWSLERGSVGDAASLAESLSRTWPGNEAVAWLSARIALARGEALPARPSLHPLLSADLQRRIARDEIDRQAAVALLAGVPVTDPTPEALALLARVLSGGLDARVRAGLDATEFTSRATFVDPVPQEGATVVREGSFGATPFRFNEPLRFRGTFGAGPHRLVYRITGSTGGALLVEPLRILPE